MAGRINVAIVYKDLGLGGVQSKIVEITNALVSRKNVDIYIFLTDAQGEFLEKIPERVRVVDLHVPLHSPQVFSLPFKLAKAFLQYKPKVVLAMMDTFGCSAVLARMMLGNTQPKIFISQNIHATRFFQQRPWSRFRRMLVKSLYPQANAIFSISDAVSRDLMQNFQISSHKIIGVKNWVKGIETDMPQAKKTIDIIYAGRFAPEKDIGLLLKAFSQLRKSRQSATLSLVGYGKEEKNIRRKIEQLKIADGVTLPGFTHNIKKHLCQARVFVMTSYNEGIPRAMLEAMALRVPVISRYFPGVREIIQHKKTGFIANSADSISECMYFLLTNSQEAERVAQSAFEYVKRNYSQKNLETLVTMLLANHE